MGFSGGGSNILKPHTHDSNIVQDGGSLRLDGITQGNLSAGSVTIRMVQIYRNYQSVLKANTSA